MKLHEKIYTLRTEKKLSQGDLAELLDVSRQSVSKWETGASVPDLDKLIKMSDLFGVTLDALVREEMAKMPQNEENSDENDQKSEEKEKKTENGMLAKTVFSARVIIGIILLCAAFIVFLAFAFDERSFEGLGWACAVLIVCAICFTVRKSTLYWCAWAVALDLLGLLLGGVWGAPYYPCELFAVFGMMFILTLYYVRKLYFFPTQKQKLLFFGAWVVLFILPGVLVFLIMFQFANIPFVVELLGELWICASPIILGVLVGLAAAWIRAWREKKNI